MAKKTYKTTDKVELADKDVGFYDSQTGFKIVRSQQKKLGKPIGAKTHTALMSGGLLVVNSKSSSSKDEQDSSDIPEDFPGRDDLIAADLDWGKVQKLSDDKLRDVNGIGPKTLEAIKEWKEENK